jgi:hypothetical protein
MDTKPLPFSFYLFVVGAITNAIFSFRAEIFAVSFGLGAAAIFLFIAALKVFWKIKHH